MTKATKTVPFVKLPNSKKKTQSVKLALAIYMGKAQPKKDEPCGTCSSSCLMVGYSFKELAPNVGFILPRIDNHGRINNLKIDLDDFLTLEGKSYFLAAVVAADGGETAAKGPYICFARLSFNLG